jgi:DNA-binding response OmpR family regulator
MMFIVEQTVIPDREWRSVILVVEDVEETRYGIERLLTASGYQVRTARDEEEATLKASLDRPDLILISLGLEAVRILPAAKRIRERAGLSEEIPIVALCVTSLDEGAEVEAGHNIYLTWPDNFDQLRAFLGRLLRQPPHVD